MLLDVRKFTNSLVHIVYSLKTTAADQYQAPARTANLDSINRNINGRLIDWINYARRRVELHKKIKDAIKEYRTA